MQAQAVPPNQWISYAITFAVLGMVLFLRLRRMRRERPLKLERLWMLPAAYALFTGVMYWFVPPRGVIALYCIAALALGAAAGWWRGRLMRIGVDPETHALNHRQSPAAILFIVVLVAVRSAARELAMAGEATLHLNALAVTDVLIAFALGLLTMQRLEMYLRATRLLKEARAARV